MTDPTNLKIPKVWHGQADRNTSDDEQTYYTCLVAGLNDDIKMQTESQVLVGRAWPGDGPLHLIKLGPGLKFTLDEVNGVGKLEIDVPALQTLLGL